jgi:hypothetical protein
MMKNRAGLLALAVLVIAILLMVFVVMPRIGGDGRRRLATQSTRRGSEVKNTVNESAKTSRSDRTGRCGDGAEARRLTTAARTSAHRT